MDFNFEHELNKTIYSHADFWEKRKLHNCFCQKTTTEGVDNESHNLCSFPYRCYTANLQIPNKVIKHGRPAPIIPQLSPFFKMVFAGEYR